MTKFYLKNVHASIPKKLLALVVGSALSLAAASHVGAAQVSVAQINTGIDIDSWANMLPPKVLRAETPVPNLRLQPVSIYPEFADIFAQALQLDNVPGGVYAVVHRDQIVELKTFGVRSRADNQPVNASTIFRIASVSKTFAGSLTSLLAERGTFNLDDPVTQYIPELQFKSPEYATELRVEHLLSQSTGVIPNAYDNLIEAAYPRERIIPHFNRINPMCTPGACYGYQNVLFSLVEDVLHEKTGQNYEALVQEELFKPLNMHHASYGIEAYLANENRAAAHIRGRNGWFSREVTPHYYHFPAAAGVNASAIDLAQWLIAHLGYYPEVLPPSAVAATRERKVRTSRDLRRRDWRQGLTDAHYGLGWRVYDFQQEELIYHGGWVQGFRAEISYSPKYEMGLVLLINAESSAINQLTPSFWRQAFARMQAEQWVPYQYANQIQPVPTPINKPASVAGFPFGWCDTCLL
ncbi:MAG: beta-lactamase family protein [Idiomarina sp.]|nr:beta-lactamase family protein [Idiomarina sp.]